MPIEILEPKENPNADELIELSQEAVVPISTEPIDDFKDLIKQSHENSISNPEEAVAFFNNHPKDFELTFEASCLDEIVEAIRHQGIEFLKNKNSINSQESLDLNNLIGEVIKDAVTHTKDREKYKFIVNIKIDAKEPNKYRFLVINPSGILSKDFASQDHDNGLGNIIKVNLANDLRGKVRNIDIMTNDKKIYHGFEFKKEEF